MRKLALLGAFAALSSALFGQAVITIQGTTGNTAGGYSSSDTYTFRFYVNGSYTAPNPGDSFVANGFDIWTHNRPGDTSIFTAVTGTDQSGLTLPGATGTYAETASYNNNMELGSGFLVFNLMQTPGGLGILAPSGDSITSFALSANSSVLNSAVFTTNFANPSQTLLSFPTTVVDSQNGLGNGYFFLSLANNNSAFFNLTSMTIQDASSVPEPSTWAAILGVTALGAVIVRRRRLKNA